MERSFWEPNGIPRYFMGSLPGKKPLKERIWSLKVGGTPPKKIVVLSGFAWRPES